jgi:hypothetical protein
MKGNFLLVSIYFSCFGSPMLKLLMLFTSYLTIRMGVATSSSGVMLHLPPLQMHKITWFYPQRHQQQICFAHVVLELA